MPYLEWVLNRPDADRGHTQYNRLFAEVEYVAGLHAVLAWDKHSKAMGVLAADVAPEGFLSARVDFIGRARSLATPRALETLDFFEARDTDAHPTFDPIGSLLLGVTLPARGTAQVRLLIGLAGDKRGAIDLIARHLGIPGAAAISDARRRKESHPIGHGEIPPGTPEPYAEFSDDGRTAARPHAVHAPAVRPHDVQRARARRLGDEPRAAHDLQRERPAEPPDPRLVRHRHARGPRRGDLPLRPGHARVVLADLSPPERRLRRPRGRVRRRRDGRLPHDQGDPGDGVDGVRPARRAGGGLSPDRAQPLGPRPAAPASRPYFQMVLAGQPEFSGPLQIRRDEGLGALFFENPRNTYRTGPAFVAMSRRARAAWRRRAAGSSGGRDVAHPAPRRDAASPSRRPRPTTGRSPPCSPTLDLPAGGERTVVVVLGQADDRRAGRGRHPQVPGPRGRGRRPRRDARLVARA